MRAVLLLLLVALAAAVPPGGADAASGGDADTTGAPARADTLRRGDLLRELQREDQDFYPPGLLELNRSLADSGLARLDSLGFRTFVKEEGRRARGRGIGISAPDLGDYNRVEGGLLAAGLSLREPVWHGMGLQLQGGYSTSSRRFRHYEALTVRLDDFALLPQVELGYTDRVVPFGSNRPAANGIRALFAADEQDYLEERGGWGGLRWTRSPVGKVEARYVAKRQLSVATHTDFRLIGNPGLFGPNPPVDEGIDRAVDLSWTAGSLASGRESIHLEHRVSGGALGGDFDYVRSSAEASARRYLAAGHELVLDLGYVRAGGDPPVQRLADAGGLSTVRGFSRRTETGREAVRGRAEILVPYDLLGRSGIPLVRRLHLQFVPWADAGRVLGGPRWLTSAGIGAQYYLGPFGGVSYLRFDAAFPLGPDRPGDVRFYLRFARGLF